MGPQYELGHLDLMNKLNELEKNINGLWVCGNYRSGVAFPDCVTFGYDHAKVVIDHLKNGSKQTLSENIIDEVVEEAALVEEAIEEEIVDVSIPYDAAAKLAYEVSDKSTPYAEFRVNYEANAVELVKSKRVKVEEPIAVKEAVQEVVVDVSIPYDAAAKLAYE